MESVKTPKGTTLPLVNLKGKPYLQVAHRMIWMNEEVPQFSLLTEFIHLDEEQTIARATVTLKNEKGETLKMATATKRETKKDFPDHTEKAETAAIGRALAMLGFGTQFAVADLDEGDRIVDAPVVDTKSARKAVPTATPAPVSATPTLAPVSATPTLAPVPAKKSSFKDRIKKTPAPASNGADSTGGF